jgi:hypothetical protein
VHVPRQWLTLFPVGASLDWSAFDLDRVGETPREPLPGDAARAEVGDLLETSDGDRLLVTDDGPVLLPDFAANVYANIVLPGDRLAKVIEVDRAPSVGFGDDAFLRDTNWPETLPDPLATDLCAQLTAASGEPPVAQLVRPGESSGVGAVPAESSDPVVDPGRGAYVLSGGWSGEVAGATPYLVDAKGRADPLIGSDAATQLGYADVAAPVVPDTWVELFGCGVQLSKQAALQPPSDAAASACD